MVSLFQPIKKEARMKKIIIVLLALFLALPAISYAGSVTSRWDIVIGGYVGVGMGLSDQQAGAETFTAARGSMRGNQNVADQYGNFFTAIADTRLNMLIKGPDGGGAKTSAFIEGDFRGATGAAAPVGQGNFMMRHAFLKLDWPNSTLLFGQTWQRFAFIPTFAAIGQVYGFADMGPFQKGSRVPRLDFEQRFGKNMLASIALVSPNSIFGTVNDTTQNAYSWSQKPFLEGEVKFNTEKCGVIGPYGLMVAADAFFGQQKNITNNQIAVAGANSNLYTDRNVNAWAVALKTFIPIIPEKNKNKAGALGFGGNLFYGQNYSWYAGAMAGMQNTYQRVNTGTNAFNAVTVAPSSFGGFGSLTYFITDKLFIDGFYGYIKSNFSSVQRGYANPNNAVLYGNPNNITSTMQAIFNVNYDLNQAVRFGIQYTYMKTTYGNFVTNAGATAATWATTVASAANSAQFLSRQGTSNQVRIGAYYFF